MSAGLPSNEWDYVIVGGGTAGCVLAARLTEDPGTSVLLLEAGGEYPGLVLSAPLPGMRHMVRYSWKYFTRQQPELGHRRISFPFGKVLGGSSSINAMMYFRGTAAAYDRWREYGNPEWGFSDVLPYFRKAERQQRGGSDVHGASGPIHVSDPRHRAPFSQAFVEACLETGMRHVEDFNGPAPEGAGFFQVTQRSGRRAGAATGYLAPARRRKNLRVETYAEVEKVVLEGDRAVGVDYRVRSGEPQHARVRRELLICAGALNSPKILMLSGIGPADELKAVGVSPKHDLPGVGRNLQDHVRIPVLYESGRRSPGDMIYWAPAALRYAVLGSGVLASNCCEAGALLRTSFATEIPDLQFVTHFQSSLYPGTVDLQFCLLRTMSRGRVTLASSDPQAAARHRSGHICPNPRTLRPPSRESARRDSWPQRPRCGGSPWARRCCPGSNSSRTMNSRRIAGRRPRPATIPPAPAGWGPDPMRSWILSCECADCGACGWWMRRSCRSFQTETRARRL